MGRVFRGVHLPTPLLQPTCGCTERSGTSGCSSISRGPYTLWHWLPSPLASPRASPRTLEVSQLHPNLPGSLKCPLGNGKPLKFGSCPRPVPGSRLRHPGAEDHPDGRGARGLPGHPELRSQGGGADLHPDVRQHCFPRESGERSPSEPHNPWRFQLVPGWRGCLGLCPLPGSLCPPLCHGCSVSGEDEDHGHEGV